MNEEHIFFNKFIAGGFAGMAFMSYLVYVLKPPKKTVMVSIAILAIITSFVIYLLTVLRERENGRNTTR